MLVGDIVSLNRNGKELLYRIDEIKTDRTKNSKTRNGETKDEIVVLKGLFHRTSLLKFSSDRELQVVTAQDTKKFAEKVIKSNEAKINELLKQRQKRLPKNQNFTKPKLLHIDADKDYLSVCMLFYKTVGIDAVGYTLDEPKQPKEIRTLLEKHSPDILVVTGHDVDRDNNNVDEIADYENSGYYVEATQQARLYEPCKNGLIVIAGACQSDYERIINAGANFASSPARIMIDVLDPCYVAESVAYTYFNKTINTSEAVKYTTTKTNGIGGVESFGVLRPIDPKFSHSM